MNYELNCEGFPLDDELRDKLLLCGRGLVLEMGAETTVKMTVKQIDGLVQGRVELTLAGRKLCTMVVRNDPVTALRAAVRAMSESIEDDCILDATGTY